MPLHLLGKKSWNVYNPANIARVKRDEAEAQAQDQAEEKRRQELLAERRLAVLRGEEVPSSPPLPFSPTSDRKRERSEDDRSSVRKKRKRFGEDDTDFEMRVARERTTTTTTTTTNPSTKSKTSNAPLVDSRGHIALFPEDEEKKQGGRNRNNPSKNEEAEREKVKKQRELEDQYTMRFANAAGRQHNAAAGSEPWYAGSPNTVTADHPGTDVWGNEDPKRKMRDVARVVAGDPLAMMKRGAAKVRDVEQERRAFNEEKAREIRQLHKEEKRREKRRRHHHHRDGDIDDLEGFTLDGQGASFEIGKRESGQEGREHRGHREYRSGSQSRDELDKDKDRHHRRSRHGDDTARHHRERRGHESSRHRSDSRGDHRDREQNSQEQSRRRSTKNG